MNSLVQLPLRCDVSALAWSVVLGSTIVMVVALLIARLLENNAAARHGVLATAMLAVLVCPVVAVVMQCLGARWLKIPMPMLETTASAEPGAAVQPRGASEEHNVAGVRHSDPAGNRDAVGGSGVETDVSTPELRLPSPSPLAVERPEAHGEDVVWGRMSVSGASLLAATGRIGLIVWGFGAAFGCLGIARGWWRVRRLLRGARPVEAEPVKQAWSEVARVLQTDRLPEILSSPDVSWPAVVGFFRAVVLLPTRLWCKLSLTELQSILVHEAAHVLRRDQLMLHVQRLATALFWPNPLMHLLSHQLSRAREDVCDNHVLRVIDGPSYGETLLRLTRLLGHASAVVPAIGVHETGRRLEQRVSSLISERRRTMVRVNAWCLGGILLVAALLLVAAGGTALVAQPPEEGPEEPAAAQVEPAPSTEEAPGDGPRGRIVEQLGLELEEVPPEEFARLKTRYRGGVRVISVKPGSPSADQGIRPGDVLVGLSRFETGSCEGIEKILDRPELREGTSRVKFYLIRGSETLFGFLPLPRSASRPEQDDDAEPPETEVSEEVIREILDRVQGSYFRPVDKQELLAAAIDGMLKSLDPSSAYLRQRELEDLHAMIDEPIVGIGVEIRSEDRRLTVVRVFPSSPAAKAGVQVGDVIEEIDDVAVQSLLKEDGLSAAVRLIRGKPGEAVTLGVRRKESDQREPVRIVRDVINIDSVRGYRSSDGEQQYLLDEEEGIGYIQIAAFTRTTAREFDAAMQKLHSRGAKRLVLDLRSCPGGPLTSAIEIADLFLDEGTIVIVTSRADTRQERRFSASEPSAYPGLPMVVLVDRYTASAAEVLAACLQDHDRATIVGERTYGRGIVQRVFPLKSGGCVKLATQSLLRPNGKAIHRFGAEDDSDDWGVTPDEGFEVILSDDERRQLQHHRGQRGWAPSEDTPPRDRQLEKSLECLRRGC